MLLSKGKKTKKTTHQDAEVQEKRNALWRRIHLWLDVRKIYIPTLPALINSDNTPEITETSLPECISLKLPSAMPPSLRTSCLYGLPEKEQRLRLAQAEDALSDLRRQLRITMGLWQYKTSQIGPSQRSTTRARALISRFNEKTTRCAQRYRAARSALLALSPTGEWQKRLRELKDEDVKGPGKGDDEAEGTRELSWIWRVEHNSAALEPGMSLKFDEVTDKDLIDGELQVIIIYFN